MIQQQHNSGAKQIVFEIRCKLNYAKLSLKKKTIHTYCSIIFHFVSSELSSILSWFNFSASNQYHTIWFWLSIIQIQFGMEYWRRSRVLQHQISLSNISHIPSNWVSLVIEVIWLLIYKWIRCSYQKSYWTSASAIFDIHFCYEANGLMWIKLNKKNKLHLSQISNDFSKNLSIVLHIYTTSFLFDYIFFFDISLFILVIST